MTKIAKTESEIWIRNANHVPLLGYLSNKLNNWNKLNIKYELINLTC